MLFFGKKKKNAVLNSTNLYGSLGGAVSSAVQYGNNNICTETALREATVYSCIKILRETAAQIPLVLYKKEGENKKYPAKDHPYHKLLSLKPNGWMFHFQWIEMMITQLYLRGNHYSFINRYADGTIKQLIPLHPDAVSVKQDSKTYEVTYRVAFANGAYRVLPKKDILHVPMFSDDGLKGHSILKDHASTIGFSQKASDHMHRNVDNGGLQRGFLTVEQGIKLSDDVRKELKADFENVLNGSGTKTVVLPSGIGYKPVSITNADLQFLETQKYERSKICGIFGVPPHLIGDLEKATFSNIENQSLEFVIYRMLPVLVRIEEVIRCALLEELPDYYVKFKVDSLLRGDAKSRAEALQIQRRNGVISANEWRDKEDMNPIEDEGGDHYIIESNMQRLGSYAENNGNSPTAGLKNEAD